MSELQERVGQSADTADLHATAPTLLLELQAQLGALAARVADDTGRGRRPFRPGPEWSHRLGELAYGVYLLADQTGVNVAEAVELTAQHIELQGQQAKSAEEHGWPFKG